MGPGAGCSSRSSPPSRRLLITDVVMPGMGGRELADTIKSRRPQIKIRYMSGYTNDEVVRHGVTLARDAFLQKPFTPSGMVAMVFRGGPRESQARQVLRARVIPRRDDIRRQTWAVAWPASAARSARPTTPRHRSCFPQR
jgi:DNA-binding NarL/FixJ family response regulator